jgi:hypothetical protein
MILGTEPVSGMTIAPDSTLVVTVSTDDRVVLVIVRVVL